MICLGVRSLVKRQCVTAMRCIESRNQRRMVKSGVEDVGFIHVSVASGVNSWRRWQPAVQLRSYESTVSNSRCGGVR